MKYILILIFLFLASCSEVSTVEEKLIGKWEWNERNGDSELSGYINLLPDHSYSYELNWKVQVERIVERFSEPSVGAKWNLENGTICLYSSDEKKKKCFWEYKTEQSGNVSVFFYKKGMRESIVANKL